MNDLHAEFNYRVKDTNIRIEQRMKVYEQMLRSTQSAFAAFNRIGSGEFHIYVSTMALHQNYPGVQGIGFELIVPFARKEMHVATIRKQGFPTYQISPAGEREYYAPSLYLEPLTDLNRTALGFDNLIEPVRRAAMEKARDYDLPIVSGKILQETDVKGFGAGENFIMYLPIFKQGAPHDTVASRRANIIGWIFSWIRMQDVMNGLIEQTAGEIDIDIHDGEIITDKSVMYDPDDNHEELLEAGNSEEKYHQVNVGGDTSKAFFFAVSRIEIAGHFWTVSLRSLRAFEMRLDKESALFIGIAGVGVSLLLALLTGVLVKARAHALKAAQAIQRELIERKRAEEGLKLAARVIHTMEEGVLVTDPDNNIISVNPAFTTLTGYSASEVVGKNPRFLSAQKHPAEFYARMWNSLLTTDSWHGDIWERRKNGELYVKWLSIKAVRDEAGKLTHYFAVFSDVSERKSAEENMRFLEYRDALTGLPNRTSFTDRLQQALEKSNRDKSKIALMLLDLDKFKPINESLGYAVGDIVLKEVARRLQNCLRECDTAARLGGDEFVILLSSINSQQEVKFITNKIQNELGKPFELNGQCLQIFASIGIAIYPEQGIDERQLVKNADIAMGYAKGSKADKVKFYNSGMEEINHYMASAPTIWALFFDIVTSYQPSKGTNTKSSAKPFMIISNTSDKITKLASSSMNEDNK